MPVVDGEGPGQLDQPLWTVCLLGSFRLERNKEVVVDFSARRDELVLAVLALTPNRAWLRTGLASLLWEGKPIGQSRRNLSYALHQLRRRLEAVGLRDVLVAEGRMMVQLAPSVRTDVAEFTDLARQAGLEADPMRRARLAKQALELYGSGLLPGFTFPWTDTERGRLEQIHRGLVELLVEAPATGPGQGRLLALLPAGAWSKAEAPSVSTVIRPEAGVHGTIPTVLPGDRARVQSLLTEMEPHLSGPEQKSWLVRIDQEYPIIECVLEQHERRGEYTMALRCAVPLWRYWYERGLVAHGHALFERLLLLGIVADDDLRARAHQAAGNLAFFNGYPDQAEKHLLEALSLWRHLGNDEGARQTRASLGIVSSRVGRLEEAGEAYQRAIADARILGDETLLLALLLNSAQNELYLSRPESARSLLDERLEKVMRTGDQAQEAQTRAYLATVELMEGDLTAAQSLAQAAVDYFSHNGDQRWTAFAERLLGRIAQEEGRLEAAEVHFKRSKDAAAASGDIREIAESLDYLADLARQRGAVEVAEQLIGQAAAVRASSQDLQEAVRRVMPTASPDELAEERGTP